MIIDPVHTLDGFPNLPEGIYSIELRSCVKQYPLDFLLHRAATVTECIPQNPSRHFFLNHCQISQPHPAPL